jgi:hypothetical protein
VIRLAIGFGAVAEFVFQNGFAGKFAETVYIIVCSKIRT